MVGIPALVLATTVVLGATPGPPVIPVGLDAYRLWDRWPYQRIGARAYMRSTYDRSGGNEGADASHFLYQQADDFNVTLDVEGPGVLYFARYNHWHGSPWHYEVDGVDHIVQETSSADPNHPKPDSVFLPEKIFPAPLTWTWSDTKGADLMWVPIPFEKSFRMAYSRTRYGTGYYIYDQYVAGAPLSQPIQAWNGKTPPAQDVLDLIRRAGTDIAPKDISTVSGAVVLANAASSVLFDREAGPAMIRAIKLRVPRDQALAFGRARLRITWDHRAQPSVDAPVALFFGAGTLYNRDDREYLVKSFPMTIRFDADAVNLACYLPMPFFHAARIELTGAREAAGATVTYEIRYEPYHDPPNDVGYLHATYRDHPHPKLGKDLVLLDTRNIEGSPVWSGSFIGTSFIFSHDAVLSTLEGDPRFFFDDSMTPQAYGTGTEEWGGGGDYWGGRNMTLPFAGHPVGAKNSESAKCPEDRIESAYRFLLADLMPFGERAVIHLEHGGENQSTEHYETVTYWYGLPSASLVQTDDLDVGDPASEKAHHYVSPNASAPVTVTSRYEWGVDHLRVPATQPPASNQHTAGAQPPEPAYQTIEVYPAQTECGRYTTGASEFSVRLRPDNQGVMLRRTLDYAFPNQRAEVYVSDPATAHQKESSWKYAGIWYLAGSNTCVYSNPREELGATQHIVQTSNRRLRDDEFLIPKNLTQGQTAIRIRVKFTPVHRPLFPEYPIPQLAWSELRYKVYCFVMPQVGVNHEPHSAKLVTP